MDTAYTLANNLSPEIRAITVTTLILAAAVVVRPTSTARFLAYNASLILLIGLRLPRTNNHGLVFFLGAATILTCAAAVALQRRSVAVSSERIHETAAPLMRWHLLVLYFWAVVQKLNVDYFALDVSCGPSEVHRFCYALPFLPCPAWFDLFAIYGTLIVETLIPVMLVSRHTRVAGLAIGIGFHSLLGISYDGFSAMLFALFALFLPRPMSETISRGAAAIFPSGEVGRWALVALLVGAGFLLRTYNPLGVVLGDSRQINTIWMIYAALVFVVFTLALWRTRSLVSEPRPLFLVRPAALLIFPLLLFFNGACPHLGLKNTLSFAMFSNLRTEAGATNHLLFPASMQLWGYQKDLVRVRTSSDPILRKFAWPFWSERYFSSYVLGSEEQLGQLTPPHWRLPFVAFRRRITQLASEGKRGISVIYERNGKMYSATNAELDPELSQQPFLEHKLLYMRAVPDGTRGYCMW